VEEVKKEDLLERPENALSYNEYKELQKQKNKAVDSKPKNVVKANETDAQPQARDESQFILGAGAEGKKAKAKPKEKKNNDVKELVVDIKTDDGLRDNRQYGKQKKDGKYSYKADDFPEL
jgi:hypothetical protein